MPLVDRPDGADETAIEGRQDLAGLVGGGIGAMFGLTIAVPLALTVRPVAISIGPSAFQLPTASTPV